MKIIDKDQVRKICEEQPQRVREMLRKTRERINSIIRPSSPVGFNLPFMPTHGYPEIHAFKLNAGESINPSINNHDSVEGYYAEIYFEPEMASELIVHFGCCVAECTLREDSSISILIGGRELTSISKNGLFNLSVRRIRGIYYFCVNSEEIREVAPGAGREQFSIACREGKVGVVQLQTMGLEGFNYVSFQNCELSRRHVVCGASPQFVLRWERTAQLIYQAALFTAVSLKFHTDDDGILQADVREFSDLMRNALLSWPYWRPSGDYFPQSGAWERNNWSNGYLPGAFGILCGLGNVANGIWRDKFNSHGLQWLIPMVDAKELLSTQFPPVSHWLRRSTNHGLVIYSTFMMGALHFFDFGDPVIDRIQDVFHKILRESLKGGYPEGFSYAQFVLQELIPYLVLILAEAKGDKNAVYSELFGDVSELADLFWYGSLDDGYLFARFGDCSDAGWSPGVSRIVNSLPGESRNTLIDMGKITNELPSFFGDAYTLLAQVLPINKKIDDSSPRVAGREFSQIGSAALRGKSKSGRNYSIWISGSKLHHTHNKDYDFASFYLYVDGSPWAIEESGREAYKHNTILLPGFNIDEACDPLTCAGDIGGSARLSGEVNIIDADEYAASVRVRIPGMYRDEGNKYRLGAGYRYFKINVSDSFVVIIVDIIEISENVDPVCQFITPNWSSEKEFVAGDMSYDLAKGAGCILGASIQSMEVGFMKELRRGNNNRVIQKMCRSGKFYVSARAFVESSELLKFSGLSVVKSADIGEESWVCSYSRKGGGAISFAVDSNGSIRDLY